MRGIGNKSILLINSNMLIVTDFMLRCRTNSYIGSTVILLLIARYNPESFITLLPCNQSKIVSVRLRNSK